MVFGEDFELTIKLDELCDPPELTDHSFEATLQQGSAYEIVQGQKKTGDSTATPATVDRVTFTWGRDRLQELFHKGTASLYFFAKNTASDSQRAIGHGTITFVGGRAC